MLFLPQEAIQINIILSLIISIALVYKIRKDIDVRIVKRFIIGSFAGIPVGVFIITTIEDMNVFKLGISVLILLLTVLLMLNFKVKPTPIRDFIVGGISGGLTTSVGMPGPPLLLYFTGTNTEKEKLRATTLAFYLFIYFVSLITQIIFMGTNKVIWESSLYAVPFVILGLFLGQLLFKWINQKVFRLFTYILLLFTGVFLLLESLF